MAQSLATITHKLFLPKWKFEACRNCKGAEYIPGSKTWWAALLQSSLFSSLISYVCNCTWTGEGLSLSIRIILKGILEAIPVLYIKCSKIKEGRNSANQEQNLLRPYQFFSSEDYTMMCYLYSCATLPKFTAEQTWSWMWQGTGKPPALSSQKFLHATTAQVSFCSFWLGQWNFGGKLWNRAVRIMAYNSSIKTNSHFSLELSAAFTEEADLCMQQRNHFKHNQRN